MSRILVLTTAFAMTCASCSEGGSGQELLDIDLYNFHIRTVPGVEYCPIRSGPGLVGYSLVFKGDDCPKEAPASRQEGVVNVYGEFNADYRDSPAAALETICAHTDERDQDAAGGAPISPLRIDTVGMSLVGCEVVHLDRKSYFFLIPRGGWKSEKASVRSVPRIFIHVEFSIANGSTANASQIMDNVVKMLVLDKVDFGE
jgi:hypothetical protein